MSAARLDVRAEVINGTLYAVGGVNDTEAVATVEAYDPVNDKWSTKAPMLTALYAPGVAVRDGIMYVVGGGTFNGPLAELEAY